MNRIVLSGIIATVLMTSLITFNPILAQDKTVPSWIKNTVSFWINGDVSDREFLNAVQFLANQGIIQVSPTKTTQIPTFSTYTALTDIGSEEIGYQMGAAYCESGDKVLSGGFFSRGEAFPIISRPVADNGWEAGLFFHEEGRGFGAVYAYCLDLTP